MCVSESKARRAMEASARSFAAATARVKPPAACFKNDRRSRTIGIESANPIGEQVFLVGSFAPHELLDVLQLFLELRTAASQAHDVKQNDQPRGREAVEHVSEVSSVHSFPLCSMRQPAQRVDFTSS